MDDFAERAVFDVAGAWLGVWVQDGLSRDLGLAVSGNGDGDAQRAQTQQPIGEMREKKGQVLRPAPFLIGLWSQREVDTCC